MKNTLKNLTKYRLVFIGLSVGLFFLIAGILYAEASPSLIYWIPDPISQGDTVTFSAHETYASYKWWKSDGPSYSCTPEDTPVSEEATYEYTFYENGDWNVCFEGSDGLGGVFNDSQTVTVNNHLPDIYYPFNWEASPEPSMVGSSFHVELGFTDYEDSGYSCTIDYGDGSEAVSGIIQYLWDNEWLCVGPNHTYTTAGEYSVQATVYDDYPDSFSYSDYYYHTVNDVVPVTLVVNTSDDPGDGTCNTTHCSLREAINAAASGETITFDSSLSDTTISLSSQLTIDKDITIDGSMLAEKVTISGGGLTRVFWVNSGKTITLDSLVIADGNADDWENDAGGGIYNDGGFLTVVNSLLLNNYSIWSGGGLCNVGEATVMNTIVEGNNTGTSGGGLDNMLAGILTIIDSTVAENSAHVGGGLYNDGVMTISGSTIVRNSVEYSGGAIYNGGSATVVNSTFTENNAASFGSGIFNFGSLSVYNSTFAANTGSSTLYNTNPTANLSIYNTIIASSPVLFGCFNDSGNSVSYANNLIGASWNCGLNNTDDPLLSPLADNGGPTKTMALQPDSPAIDAGNDTICGATPVNGVDQRGIFRPQNENCDIGAYELLEFDILPYMLPPATVGFHYSQQFTAVGGNPPYIWSSSGLGGVPFTLYTNGLLESDDNILDPAVPGVITFTAIWEDSSAVEFRKEYSLTVSAPLAFSPTTLPTGKVGEVYSQVITLTGGTAPYAIDPVSIPAWLTYDADPDTGTITFSGTPTEHGSFSIEIQVADVLGVQGKKTYKFWIGPEQAFTWSPENPNQFEGVNFTAVPDLGGTNLKWWRGDNPGDTCDTYVYTMTNILYVEFNKSGSYQICMDYWVDSINGYVRDEQWVAINNVPPEDVYIGFNQEPSFMDTSVFAIMNFFDWDIGSFTCTLDWGDGSDSQTVTADFNQRCEFPGHIYTAAGSYSVSGYVTEEGVGSSEPRMKTLEVLDPATLPPIAWDDEWLVGEVGPSRIRLEASDFWGIEDLIFNIVDSPIHGMLSTPVFETCVDNEDPFGGRICSAVVEYTPDILDPLYNGSDSFTFTASDEGITSDPGNISLLIAPNDAPTAYDNSLTVVSTAPTKIVLTATDPDVINNVPDNLEIEISSLPDLGSLEGLHKNSFQTGPSEVNYSWVVTYTPDGSTGADSFEFRVTDNNYHMSSAIIDLTVRDPITWHVNTFDDIDDGACDSDHCSLREAVQYAVSGDAVDFEGLLTELPGTIVLSGEQIQIDKDLTVIGPGATLLAVSGGAELNDENPWEHSRVFLVSGFEVPVDVTISGLTIRDGRDNQGGGVQVSEGSNLIMNDCVIGPNNIVTYAGGGIFNERASLTLNRCTVTGNEGTGSLGGAGVTTAYSGATTTLINSTVSGNITNNYGGGIFVGPESLVRLIHTTVTGNLSNANFAEPNEERGGGAGIYIDPYGDSQLEVQNSIIAGNTDLTVPEDAGHDKWPDVYGSVTSLGGNLIGDDSGSSGWNENDLVGTASDPIDPGLDPVLTLNAPGSTPTHALLPGSLAMDAVHCLNDVRIDQRGISRPQGYFCDIGAYEFEQEPVFWDVFLPLIIGGSAN